MTLEIIDCVQRSDEWFAARRGMITASIVSSLITPTGKVAKNAASRGVIAALAAERLTDDEDPSYMNADMIRGVEYEPVIRDRYAEVNNVTVTEVGFMIRTLPTGARLGCSPDGLVGDAGGIEIKSPRAKGHIQTVLADEVPPHYVAQIQAALLVTGREWWDYLSAAAGRLYPKRVYPDPVWFAAITEAVTAAEKAIEAACNTYLTRAESLPTIAPYINPYDIEVSI